MRCNPWLFCAITYSASTAAWKVMHGSTLEVGCFGSRAWTALLYYLKAGSLLKKHYGLLYFVE